MASLTYIPKTDPLGIAGHGDPARLRRHLRARARRGVGAACMDSAQGRHLYPRIIRRNRFRTRLRPVNAASATRPQPRLRPTPDRNGGLGVTAGASSVVSTRSRWFGTGRFDLVREIRDGCREKIRRKTDSKVCLLLYSPSDRYLQEFFIESAYPSRKTVADVYEYLRNHTEDPIEITQHALKDELDLSISAEGVGTCERLLEKSGVLKRLDPDRNMAAVTIDSELPTLLDLLPTQSQIRRKVLAAVEQLVGSRRQEFVYFYPHQIVQATSLSLASVSRALRELNNLADFDYVPPFRGRALHLTRRDLNFDELVIDFDTLEKHKQADWNKLNRIIQFAKTRHCRQREVLRYFGENTDATCGHCDNCHDVGTMHDQPQEDHTITAPNEEFVEAVRWSSAAWQERTAGSEKT